MNTCRCRLAVSTILLSLTLFNDDLPHGCDLLRDVRPVIPKLYVIPLLPSSSRLDYVRLGYGPV